MLQLQLSKDHCVKSRVCPKDSHFFSTDGACVRIMCGNSSGAVHLHCGR